MFRKKTKQGSLGEEGKSERHLIIGLMMGIGGYLMYPTKRPWHDNFAPRYLH